MPKKQNTKEPKNIIRTHKRGYYHPSRKPKEVKSWKDLNIGKVFNLSLLD
jgi:hypothetical protein